MAVRLSHPAQKQAAHKQPLALYFHWPFCQTKCPYCDFNSHVRPLIDHKIWARALVSAFDGMKARMAKPDQFQITSIYFGGGTPSLMQAETVEKILAHIAQNFSMADDCEITLEANPSSSERQKFKDFKAAGVNRLSLGVQSLSDHYLQFLGRPHNAADARKALEAAGQIFDRFSFDLIYGMKGQGAKRWQKTLTEALTLAGDHLSLYMLTIEPGTHFHTLARQGKKLCSAAADGPSLYKLTSDITAAAGFSAYEVSNYAKAGGQSRHNLSYWRYENYLGIGPGAHSRLTDDMALGSSSGSSVGGRADDGLGGGFGDRQTHALIHPRLPETWLKAVQDNALASQIDVEILSPAQRQMEILLMGLRLAEGVPESRFGMAGFSWLNQDFLAHAFAKNWLDRPAFTAQRKLLATPKGRLRLDGLIQALISP